MRPFPVSVSRPSRLPPTSTSPLSALSKPAIIDTVVVLPAPLGPSSPSSSPLLTANVTSSTATSEPNVLRRFLTLSIGSDAPRSILSLMVKREASAERCIPTSGRFRRTSGRRVPVNDPRPTYVSICHMKRTTVFIPEALERELQLCARQEGRPTASLVREALAEYVARHR